MGGDIPYKGMNSNGKSNILSIFYFPDTLDLIYLRNLINMSGLNK